MSYPQPIFNFIPKKTLHPLLSYTRASSATVTDSTGKLRIVGNNKPRYDHDPLTGICKGLLIEEQRTNLLYPSEDFSNAAWTKTRATITANAAVAPDGTMTADKLVEDTTASSVIDRPNGATHVRP
ncbi:phage head spike fiber domain-containing protein [Fundidesulfovibrio putealis]|uniref:phage head spike fiber domain-containing protein n=1 Tax=Fundidesulfovibrio putealis TaxID=270496 RepID=UPI0012EB9C32|nr:hypothetical protein [Fundidesulfovibrio putealis]